MRKNVCTLGGKDHYGTTVTSTPTRIGSDIGWSSVSAGRGQTCGINAGELYCFGNNQFGQLGEGAEGLLYSGSPVRIGVDADWTTVSASGAHVGGTREGELYCWGNNSGGELGNGTTNNEIIPAHIGDPSGWSVISAGSGYTCGIRFGELYCWGNNDRGKLGDGSGGIGQAYYVTLPSHVGIAVDWSSVDANGFHTCGILAKKAYCWGINNYGQLGDGNSGADVYTNTPVPVVEP